MDIRENEQVFSEEYIQVNDNEVEEELDRFTQFMFGKKTNRRLQTYSDKDERSRDEHGDWFIKRKNSNQSFGLFPTKKRNSNAHQNLFLSNNSNKGNLGQIEDIINNLDYVEIMDKIDTFISATNQLKPLYKDVKKMVSQFINKK